jgi:hypothetical protein
MFNDSERTSTNHSIIRSLTVFELVQVLKQTVATACQVLTVLVYRWSHT